MRAAGILTMVGGGVECSVVGCGVLVVCGVMCYLCVV